VILTFRRYVVTEEAFEARLATEERIRRRVVRRLDSEETTEN
jgi:hypothetical protein